MANTHRDVIGKTQFRILATAHNNADDLDEWIAHQNSIEKTVIEQIRGRNDTRAAAVIWALLKVADKFKTSRVTEIEDVLSAGSAEWDGARNLHRCTHCVMRKRAIGVAVLPSLLASRLEIIP